MSVQPGGNEVKGTQAGPAAPSTQVKAFVPPPAQPLRLKAEAWLRRFAFVFPALALIIGAELSLHLSRSLERTTLTLRSNPDGASVFVNGLLAGATPLFVGHVKPGTYSLRLEKQGYVPIVKSIEVPTGGVTLAEELPPIGVGSLSVDIIPKAAEVLLDGEFVGHTPLQRDDIPVGTHELVIRKANFKTYAGQVVIEAGQCAQYRSLELEDQVLDMLRREVELENWRVAHYMDLGHYLFVNDQFDKAAEAYGDALRIAGSPLELPKDTEAVERNLQTRLRAEDINRLNSEIKVKSNWPGKDVARFRAQLDKQKELIANTHCTEWVWVREQAEAYANENRLDKAQALYLKHINAVDKGSATLPQAYIGLLTVRLKMGTLPTVKETYDQFNQMWGTRPELLRQLGHEIYKMYSVYQGAERAEVLALSEKTFRNAVALTQKGDAELNALCKFELANVLGFAGRNDQAVTFYRESIDGTKDVPTKELRIQKLAECHRALGQYADARAVLTELAKSPREAVAAKAKADLKELDNLKPSPEGK